MSGGRHKRLSQEIGAIDEELWQAWVRQFQEVIKMKGVAETLESRRNSLRPSFLKFVDEHRDMT